MNWYRVETGRSAIRIQRFCRHFSLSEKQAMCRMALPDELKGVEGVGSLFHGAFVIS